MLHTKPYKGLSRGRCFHPSLSRVYVGYRINGSETVAPLYSTYLHSTYIGYPNTTMHCNSVAFEQQKTGDKIGF